MRYVLLEVASFFQVFPEEAEKSLAVVRQEPIIMLSSHTCTPAASMWEPVSCTLSLAQSISWGNHNISHMPWQCLAFYVISDYTLQNKGVGVFGDKLLE